MNSVLLNYLQSNQQPQDPRELFNNNVQIQPTEQTGNDFSPFDSGIRRAIESARESLGMTEKQQDKAMNRAMLSFADNMANQPVKKGFMNNLGAVSRAIAPAIIEHDNAEEQYEKQNNIMANQIIAHQRQQAAEEAKAEEIANRRQMEEEKLNEIKRFHDMQNQFQQARLNNSPTQVEPEIPGNEFVPIESKNERSMYAKDKKGTGEILNELSSIGKDYFEFRELAKNDIIDPMTPYKIGQGANTVKDFFSYFSNDKEGRKQTIKRKALEAKLGKFAVEIERKLKGGILTEGMVKRFEDKGLLPNINDAPDVFEEKLRNLTEEIAEKYKAAEMSLRYNAHISPYDLNQLEQGGNSSSEGEVEENINVEQQPESQILMQGPNGKSYAIPAEFVQEALNDGLRAIE